jgi:hypothetical protein
LVLALIQDSFVNYLENMVFLNQENKNRIICGILAIIGKGKDLQPVKDLSRGCHIGVQMKMICF